MSSKRTINSWIDFNWLYARRNSRVIFADSVVRQKLSETVPIIQTPAESAEYVYAQSVGATNTTVEELNRYLNSVSVPSIQPPSPPPPPTGLSATPGNTQALISFTQSSDGGSPITNYQYSIDGGSTFTPFSPAQTSTTVTISGLTNGITYTIALKAVNANGISIASGTVTVTPAPPPPIPTFPDPPTNLIGIPGDAQATISFNPGFDGNSPIIDYEYSTDNGVTFMTSGVISPPVIILALSSNPLLPLVNGTTYNIVLRAVNAIGPSINSQPVPVTPSTTPSAPTGLSGTPGNQEATISFTAGSDGGLPITNYQYSTDNGVTFVAFSPADTTSPVTITTTSDTLIPLVNGTSYSIALRAVNANGPGTASAIISVTPSPGGQAKLATRSGGTSTENQGYTVLKVDISGNVYQIVPHSAALTIYNYSSAPVGGGEVGTSVYGILPVGTNFANYALIKYNSDGVVQWATRVPASLNNNASITVDNSGNVYYSADLATGSLFDIYNYTSAPVGGGNIGITKYGSLPLEFLTTVCVLKYNSSGSISYATNIKGTTQSSGIDVDSDGNAYVATVNANKTWGTQIFSFTSDPGTPGGTVNTTIFGRVESYYNIPPAPNTPQPPYPARLVIIKYNNFGVAQWASIVDGVSNTVDFSSNTITVDNSGNVYAACFSNNLFSNGPCTIRSFSSANPSAQMIFTTWGTIAATNTAGVSIGALLVKYNSADGSAISATKIELSGASAAITRPMYLSHDSSNNIYFGSVTNTQFNATLNFFSYTSGGGGGSAVTTTSFGSISNVGFGTSFVVKYNNSFAVQWVNITGGNNCIGGVSSCDNSGNFYMTLSYPETIGSIINITLNDYTSVTSGTINVTPKGVLQGDASGCVFLIKYNSSGAVIWGTRIGGINEDRNSAVAFDNNGNVWVSGLYNSNPVNINSFVSFPALPSGNISLSQWGTLPDIDPGSTSRNAFLVKYDT